MRSPWNVFWFLFSNGTADDDVGIDSTGTWSSLVWSTGQTYIPWVIPLCIFTSSDLERELLNDLFGLKIYFFVHSFASSWTCFKYVCVRVEAVDICADLTTLLPAPKTSLRTVWSACLPACPGMYVWICEGSGLIFRNPLLFAYVNIFAPILSDIKRCWYLPLQTGVFCCFKRSNKKSVRKDRKKAKKGKNCFRRILSR